MRLDKVMGTIRQFRWYLTTDAVNTLVEWTLKCLAVIIAQTPKVALLGAYRAARARHGYRPLAGEGGACRLVTRHCAELGRGGKGRRHSKTGKLDTE